MDENIENNCDFLIISFYKFVEEKHTKINGFYDLKYKPYWDFDGKTIEELLLIFKNEI